MENDILLKPEILKSNRNEMNYIECNKSINTKNIIWVNINKPKKNVLFTQVYLVLMFYQLKKPTEKG